MNIQATPPYKNQTPVILGKCVYFGEHAEIIHLLRYFKAQETNNDKNDKQKTITQRCW